MPRLRFAAVARALVVASVVSACVTQRDCEARVARARALGAADAAACTLAPETLPAPTCGGADRQPTLTYLASWCASASLPCVREQPSAYALCFGAGPDTGLGALGGG